MTTEDQNEVPATDAERVKRMLLERSGAYIHQIKFGSKTQTTLAREAFERAREYAASKGCDVSGFSDARYAEIKPVPEQKKRPSWL